MPFHCGVFHSVRALSAQNTIHHRYKENKWVEASLVEVCTVASRVGAFAQCIEDGVTGFLCSDDEWYSVLTKLVQNEKLRNEMAFRAYSYCRENYVTTRKISHYAIL